MINPKDVDDDTFHEADQLAWSPISPLHALSNALPLAPPPPPDKTQEELIKLCDELMQFLKIDGLSMQLAEFILLKAACAGYNELAQIAILAGANIHMPHPHIPGDAHSGQLALDIAQKNGHQNIAALIIIAKQEPVPFSPTDLLTSQIELSKMFSSFAHSICLMPNVNATDLATLRTIKTLLMFCQQGAPQQQATNITKIRQTISLVIGKSTGLVATHIFPFVIQSDSYPLWEIAIKAGMPFNNALNQFHQTPLHRAAQSGRLDIATLLITHGANVNSQEAPNKDTPLMLAVRDGHLNMVKLLLEKGASIHLQNNLNQSASTINPIEQLASHLIAPQVFTRQFKAHRDSVKLQINFMYLKHKAVREFLHHFIQKRKEENDQWKSAVFCTNGQLRMKMIQLELIDLFFMVPDSQRNSIYALAKKHGHNQICELCERVGINSHSSPLLLSRAPELPLKSKERPPSPIMN